MFDVQFTFKVLLLHMHFGLVFESALVENFVLALARVKTILVALVVVQLVHHGTSSIVSPDSLVLHRDLVDLALPDKLVVLTVSDLAFLSSLELLPRLHFDHGGVGVFILLFELELFQLFSKPFLKLSLLDLFLVDSLVGFEEALLPRCLLSRSQVLRILLLLSPAGVLFVFPAVTVFLDLGGVLHQLFCFHFLGVKIFLSHEVNFLLLFAADEFQSFTQLSD